MLAPALFFFLCSSLLGEAAHPLPSGRSLQHQGSDEDKKAKHVSNDMLGLLGQLKKAQKDMDHGSGEVGFTGF